MKHTSGVTPPESPTPPTFRFTTNHTSTTSRARAGTITSPHGTIQTPAFVTVGTKATVKSLAPEDLEKTGTQFLFANTYHLVLSPTADIIAKHGGVHAMSGINKPMITDSGGFQVFSLARTSKDDKPGLDFTNGQKPTLVKITDNGVAFRSHIDGTLHTFTPEFSIEAQHKIGADFIVAFDECIHNDADKRYTERATHRTHEWAQRSIDKLAELNTNHTQKMYGVIQGGRFKDLRKNSARSIADMDFHGIALGGLSVGESAEEMHQEISWIMDEIHEDTRQRHLLGVSTFDDVLDSVKQGLDTFDCVLPTRDARTGKLYIRTTEDAKTGIGRYESLNIMQSKWRSDLEKINTDILDNTTYAYLHHLYKQRELLAYRLGTMHNLYMIEQFFAEIREAIRNDRL